MFIHVHVPTYFSGRDNVRIIEQVGTDVYPYPCTGRFSGRDIVRITEQVGKDVYPCPCTGSDILHNARKRTKIPVTAEKTYNP